jgi:hypothetical protein
MISCYSEGTSNVEAAEAACGAKENTLDHHDMGCRFQPISTCRQH